MSLLRQAVRQLFHAPVVAVVAILTLALGLGANAVVFSWIQTTLLNPIPALPDAGRVVSVTSHQPWDSGGGDPMSYPDARDLAEAGKSVFAGITGAETLSATLREGGRVEWVYGQSVLANFFSVLAIPPHLGSLAFPNDDTARGASPQVVISHELWRVRFQSDPAVVGRSVQLNGNPFTIIGVAPAGFIGTLPGVKFGFWVPAAMQAQFGLDWKLTDNRRGWHWLQTLARLAPGVTQAEAAALAGTVARRLAGEHPGSNQRVDFRVTSLARIPFGGTAILRPLLSAVLAATAFVLLLVVVNLANLQLARATTRQREIGIRLAMGATRGHILRQLLVENVILALIAGLVGLALAASCVKGLNAFLPTTSLPIGYSFALQPGVVAVSLLLAGITGALFGLAPAWEAMGTPLSLTIRDGVRGSDGFGPRHRLRQLLVVAQIALAVVLLVGAGLCLRSFQAARQMDLGFQPRNVWTAGLRGDAVDYNREQMARLMADLKERLTPVPGVKSVSWSAGLPLGFEGGSVSDFTVSGYLKGQGENMAAALERIGPGYFQTMEIRLISGREFYPADDPASPPVAIVSEALAAKYFPGRDPVGLEINIWGQNRRIVGVVRTIKLRSLAEAPQNIVYAPQTQVGPTDLTLIVRTGGAASQVAQSVEQAVASLAPNLRVFAAKSLEDAISPAYFIARLAAVLLGGLGLFALLLAMLGIYGMMAFNVSRRVRELGIRLALGAPPATVRALVLNQGVRLAGAGMLLGIAGAGLATRLLQEFLVGVSPFDGPVFLGVLLLLAGVAMIACWLPARRASLVDPLVALRVE